MDRGLVTLIGMSIAYAASFVGLSLAWWSWHKKHKKDDNISNISQEKNDSRESVDGKGEPWR